MAPQLTLVPQKCIIFDVFTTSTKASEPTNIISLNTPVFNATRQSSFVREKKIAVHHLIVVNTVCVRVKSTVQVTKLQTIFSPGRCYGILCSTLCSLWCFACFKNQTNEEIESDNHASLPARLHGMVWVRCVCKIHSTKFDVNKIFRQFRESYPLTQCSTFSCPYEF